MFKVTFKAESSKDVTVFAAFGETLLDVARKANIPIDAPCSGNGSCGKCRVKIVSGKGKSKKSIHISEDEYSQGIRLACHTLVDGDMIVEVPKTATSYQSGMRISDLSSPEETAIFEATFEDIRQASIPIENGFSILDLDMEPPTVENPMPDNERIVRDIQRRTGTERVAIPLSVMQVLPDRMREGDFKLKCAVKISKGCTYVYNVAVMSDTLRAVGIALDIGTTSVSALAVDMNSGTILAKASAGNAQIRYGADVINRIVESTREGGLKRLQKAVIDETVNPLIEKMCHGANIHPWEICRVSVAANTTMNHLFTGINPDPLRKEPYVPAFYELEAIYARDIGLIANPNASVIFAPNVGSYVGGDITAGTFASMMWNRDEFTLFIDLGTNGEIVLGNRDFLMSCACSAGPAFEGGEISCGMRATDGAIEAVSIDRDTMDPTYRTIGGVAPVGICGSGIIDLVGELFLCGIIDARGRFVKEGERILRDEYGVARYVIAFGDESGTSRELAIDEVDIESFIRAKGAIYSAIITMLDSLSMEQDMIESVLVAGGIGSGINIKNAIRIGMFPNLPEDRFSYIGNTSLTGSYAMLLSDKAAERIQDIGRNMTYLELSVNPRYMDEFIAACFLPHTNSSLFE